MRIQNSFKLINGEVYFDARKAYDRATQIRDELIDSQATQLTNITNKDDMINFLSSQEYKNLLYKIGDWSKDCWTLKSFLPKEYKVYAGGTVYE